MKVFKHSKSFYLIFQTLLCIFILIGCGLTFNENEEEKMRFHFRADDSLDNFLFQRLRALKNETDLTTIFLRIRNMELLQECFNSLSKMYLLNKNVEEGLKNFTFTEEHFDNL